MSSTLEPPLTALQRLEASRASMRRYLVKSDRPEDKDDSTMSGIAGTVNGWIEGLRTNPVTAAVVDAVHGWWQHHPLHTISRLGVGAARDVAEPYIRKYPLSCVGGALVVGVIAARIKPWRWVIRPAMFAGLSSHIVTRLLSDAPLEFVLDALNRFKHTRADGTTAADSTAASTQPSPSSPPPATVDDINHPPFPEPTVTRVTPDTTAPAEAATTP